MQRKRSLASCSRGCGRRAAQDAATAWGCEDERRDSRRIGCEDERHDSRRIGSEARMSDATPNKRAGRWV